MQYSCNPFIYKVVKDLVLRHLHSMYAAEYVILFLILIHRDQNSKQIDIAKYVSNFLIYGAKMLDKCVKSQKNFLYIVLFCKVKLSKMAAIKTNKIKKQTALF